MLSTRHRYRILRVRRPLHEYNLLLLVDPHLVPTPANLPVSQVSGVTAFAPRGPSPLPTPSDNGLDDKNESFLAFVAFWTEKEHYCVT
jgi:hypothetical protein